jgi:hypothetical protein
MGFKEPEKECNVRELIRNSGGILQGVKDKGGGAREGKRLVDQSLDPQGPRSEFRAPGLQPVLIDSIAGYRINSVYKLGRFSSRVSIAVGHRLGFCTRRWNDFADSCSVGAGVRIVFAQLVSLIEKRRASRLAGRLSVSSSFFVSFLF